MEEKIKQIIIDLYQEQKKLTEQQEKSLSDLAWLYKKVDDHLFLSLRECVYSYYRERFDRIRVSIHVLESVR